MRTAHLQTRKGWHPIMAQTAQSTTSFVQQTLAQRIAEVDAQIHHYELQIEIDQSDIEQWNDNILLLAERFGWDDPRIGRLEENIRLVRRHCVTLRLRQKAATELLDALTRESGEEA